MYQSRRFAGFGSENELRIPRYSRAGLLLSPFVLLLCSYLPSWGSLHFFTQVAGWFSLLTLPGYLVLWTLGSDPLDMKAPGYRWPLVVPLSLSVNVILGILLVLTPIGLSVVSLWVALSVLTVISILISVVRG